MSSIIIWEEIKNIYLKQQNPATISEITQQLTHILWLVGNLLLIVH